ncbi:MAG: hypothetical protein KDK90_24455 [Leptospiraceae bacterium]|nr:hypothetical protein [Leptospiraceae bacterium]
MYKLFIFLGTMILICSCSSTHYFGVTEEEYKKNPSNYSVLYMSRAGYVNVTKVDGKEAGSAPIYLSPGQHSIDLRWLKSPPGIFRSETKNQPVKYNFKPGVNYKPICISGNVYVCDSWDISPKKINF